MLARCYNKLCAAPAEFYAEWYNGQRTFKVKSCKVCLTRLSKWKRWQTRLVLLTSVEPSPERRSPARYWPHAYAGPKVANDTLLRLRELEAERASLDLVGQLMGDPPRSRQHWRTERESG